MGSYRWEYERQLLPEDGKLEQGEGWLSVLVQWPAMVWKMARLGDGLEQDCDLQPWWYVCSPGLLSEYLADLQGGDDPAGFMEELVLEAGLSVLSYHGEPSVPGTVLSCLSGSCLMQKGAAFEMLLHVM